MELKSFKDLFTFTQDLALILRGPRLRVEFANPAHLNLYGSDATGLELVDVYSEMPHFLQQILGVRESGYSRRVSEVRLKIAQHSYIFQMTYSYIDNEDPDRRGVMVLGHDVTEDVMARQVTTDQKIALEMALNDSDFSHILKILVESSERILGPDAQCCILTVDEHEKELVYGATSRLPRACNEDLGKVFIKDNFGSCGTSAFRRRPLFIADIQSHDYWFTKRAVVQKYNLKSCYSVPIFSSRGNVLGTFAVYNHFQVDLRPFEERLVELMADTVGVIIERAEEVKTKKEVESVLNETQERLNSAVSAAKIGFFDVKSGRDVFYLSSQMQEDWNLPAELKFSEIHRLYNKIHPEDRERVVQKARESFHEGVHYMDEYRILPTTDTVRWVQVTGSVEKASGDVAHRFFGTCVDVTQKKREALARAESENLFKLVTDAVPALISYVTPDFRYKFVNAFYERWFNRPKEQIIGREIREVFGEQAVELRRPQMEAALRGEESRIEAPVWFATGEKRYTLSLYIPDFDKSGEVRGIIVLAMDTTQEALAAEAIRTAKEAAESANASKSEFLANMSHEIRTPLGAMLGYAEFLKSDVPTQKREQYVDTILKNGKALIRILDDILDLSKVEAGRMDVEWSSLELKPFLDEVVDLFSERARDKGLDLAVKEFGLPTSITITTDPLRLRQILVNIIGNAIKFTHEGSVQIKVFQEDKEKIIVQVEDTGIGLTPQQAQKLFSAFTQADTSVTREYGGTGLGLHLSRRLSERLGGDLQLVRSVEGVGSVFQLSLPLSLSLALPEAPPDGIASFIDATKIDHQEDRENEGGISHIAHHIKTSATAQSLSQKEKRNSRIKRSVHDVSELKVLVVDDSEDNRDIISIFLESLGIGCDLAENGEQAIESMSRQSYDLVLMDIQMPVLDGYGAIKKLRNAGCETLIWALTAHAMQQERDKSLASGFDDHLTKPIQFEEMRTKILDLIQS